MKYLVFFVLFFVVFSCQKDIKNDQVGLNVTSKGLAPKNVILFENMKQKSDKNIKFGSQLTVELNGIDDFESNKENRVFPGGENSVVDENMNVIFFVPDYFKKYEFTGVSVEDAAKLKFNLTIGKPMEIGKKYHFLFKVWDKKSKKELKGNLEFDVI